MELTNPVHCASGFSTSHRVKPFSLSRLALLFVIGLLAHPALSDVKVQPTFGHPYIFADRIVFTSVDGTHLIAIDKKGKLQWELKFPDRIFVEHTDEALSVQTAKHVYKIELADGKKSEMFVMP